MSSQPGDVPRSSGPAADDAVDRLLDDLVSGAGLSLGDPLAEAAWQVRALATEPLPPETRERHLALIRQTLPAPRRIRPFLGLRRRVAVVVTAVTTALTFSGGVTYAAAQQALPGDALYGLKRATERLALAVERDQAEDAKLRVSFAQRRLREAVAAPELVDELVAEAIAQLEAAASVPGAAGSQSLDVIRELLEGRLPGPASEQAQYALAQVCVDLALERNEQVPPACAAEAEATPPAGEPSTPRQSVQGGAGEQAPAGPPPPGPQPAGPPPPEGRPPAGQPPAGQPPAAPPPAGPPPGQPPPPGEDPPPDVDEPTAPQPPDQDPGRNPRGRGKGRAESDYRAPDSVGGPSHRRTTPDGPGRAGGRGRPPR